MRQFYKTEILWEKPMTRPRVILLVCIILFKKKIGRIIILIRGDKGRDNA